MNSLLMSVMVMGGLGGSFGVALAVAYRYLRVRDDPRVERVSEMLPGSNCGACGEPGCLAFAGKVVAGAPVLEGPVSGPAIVGCHDFAEKTASVEPREPSGCTVASPAVVQAIAEYLGVDAGSQTKRVARLRCAGGRSRARQLASYRGHEGCRAAQVVGGAGKECAWGCLGFGDCAAACDLVAIRMNADDLPEVSLDLCTACGDCVEACPRQLFEVLPLDRRLLLRCNAPLSGDRATEICTVACDACGRCALDAAPNLIRMENNLPVIDYARGGPASALAVLRCPTGAIQWVTDSAGESVLRS